MARGSSRKAPVPAPAPVRAPDPPPVNGARVGPGDRLARRTDGRPARRPVIPPAGELTAAAVDPLSAATAADRIADGMWTREVSGGRRTTSGSAKSVNGKSVDGKSVGGKSANGKTGTKSGAAKSAAKSGPAAAKRSKSGKSTVGENSAEKVTEESTDVPVDERGDAAASDRPGASENAGNAGDSGAAGESGADRVERAVSGVFSFLRRRLAGEYAVDEFGFDRDLTENVLAGAARPLYEKWFRVEARGLENVPSEGAALLVGNHAGNLMALDSVMIMMALLDHHPAHRNLRLLAADLVFSTPLLGALARKAGGTVACNADAERLLAAGELVGVWPEGFKGIGKPFRDRYKLQRFGRGGFVSAALHAGSPIVPVSVVGAEEIYPKIGELKVLARLFGLPYFPVTPTFPQFGPLGLVPLPSKWFIEFGTPIPTAELADGGDDPMLLMNLSDQVRETIQQTLYRLLLERDSIFG